MADPLGVSVAFGADALDASPTWTRLDDLDSYPGLFITGWQTNRGRNYFTDKNDAGTAQADFTDTAGVLDPTNASGPFYPMNPNCPFAIALYNPVADEWTTVFTGMLQSMPTTLDTSENWSTGSLMAADLFALLAIAEIPPGVDFDNTDSGTNTANEIGDTTYAAQSVQDRIKAILADALVPVGLTDIFTGNVDLQKCVEPPGTQVLQVLQDAADGEFPGVANLYMDKTGVVNFKGRLARFNPTDPTYGINTWHVGDRAAVDAHSSWAQIQTLSFDRDAAKIINAALFAPQGIADTDIAGQLVADSGSVTTYGTRTYTGSELLTAGGETDGNDANQETKLFADYYVDNFKDPATLISQVTFTNPKPGAANETAQWLFLCGVEISDVVVITTTHPGGGGFATVNYFVEGIQYQAVPAQNGPLITMTLTLSPAVYYGTNPFPS